MTTAAAADAAAADDRATPAGVQATCCATFVDEWVRCGVTDAVLSPGSRSTPLALALADAAAAGRLRLHVHHDERAAAFTALGLGLASGRPAVLLCTSGTAAANFHPAVIEAHQASVPLLVCTADRPGELRDVGAPQTVDQTHLFGRAVRWFHDPGVPDAAGRPHWRSVAARAVAEAVGPWPGPVHLNLPLREPLVGTAGELPAPAPGGRPWHRTAGGVVSAAPADAEVAGVAALLDAVKGVIVAGRGSGDPEAVHALAEACGWPVLADPRSPAWGPWPGCVAAADALLRHQPFAADHRPAVVLHLGEPPASKVVNQWLAASGATHVHVGAEPTWRDPARQAAVRVVGDPAAWCRALTGRIAGAAGRPWAARWRHAEAAAQAVYDERLGAPDTAASEAALARWLVAALPAGATLVVSSSMPVRDVEWFGRPRAGLRVLANRGANGIDGVVSTAVGVALATSRPTAVLVGDVAFLHDSNALLGLARRPVDLAIVVVDNDGGGIFEFLPQAGALDRDRFEGLFGTPHGVDPGALAAVHGLGVHRLPAADPASVAAALADGAGRARLVHLRTDRVANVRGHGALHDAVAAALGPAQSAGRTASQ